MIGNPHIRSPKCRTGNLSWWLLCCSISSNGGSRVQFCFGDRKSSEKSDPLPLCLRSQSCKQHYTQDARRWVSCCHVDSARLMGSISETTGPCSQKIFVETPLCDVTKSSGASTSPARSWLCNLRAPSNHVEFASVLAQPRIAVNRG